MFRCHVQDYYFSSCKHNYIDDDLFVSVQIYAVSKLGTLIGTHPIYAAYVDLHAAFDSLSRSSLWLLLTRLGIPYKIVRGSVRQLCKLHSYVRIRECLVPNRVQRSPRLCWQPTRLPRAWTGC